MRRRLPLLALPVLLGGLAACGEEDDAPTLTLPDTPAASTAAAPGPAAAPVTTIAAPPGARAETRVPPVRPRPAARPRARPLFAVLVADRVRNRPVAGAVVRLGRARVRTNAAGVALLPRPTRRTATVVVRRRGFEERRLTIPVRRLRPFHRVHLWRRGWSWPTYGGGPTRTQTVAASPSVRRSRRSGPCRCTDSSSCHRSRTAVSAGSRTRTAG
jgi:hypothetical protein